MQASSMPLRRLAVANVAKLGWDDGNRKKTNRPHTESKQEGGSMVLGSLCIPTANVLRESTG